MMNNHQTKKKRRRQSLPEKQFRIMIVKVIQNLESKIELQINRLEMRFENMQKKSLTRT